MEEIPSSELPQLTRPSKSTAAAYVRGQRERFALIVPLIDSSQILMFPYCSVGNKLGSVVRTKLKPFFVIFFLYLDSVERE